MNRLQNCKIINITNFHDSRGNLCVIEGNNDIPFDIKRIYYIYGNSESSLRGVHAHRKLKQFIIAISGEFKLHLSDGISNKTYTLNSPEVGIYVSPGIWREISDMTNDAVCLVIASRQYEPADYIFDFIEFKKEFT